MLNMVGYVRFTKNICTMQVLQEVLFQFALVSIWNVQHVSKQHEKSGRHQRLRKKLYKSENELKETLQRAELSLVEKVKVNTSCITKCIHTIYYLIRKNIAINTYYADLIRFFATELQQPITKQYLNACPKNALNIYFEKLNMREIRGPLPVSFCG